MGPSAPHGTWEKQPVVSAKTLTGKRRKQSPGTVGCEGLLATGSVCSFAQDWAALQLQEAEVWPALAKQPSSNLAGMFFKYW